MMDRLKWFARILRPKNPTCNPRGSSQQVNETFVVLAPDKPTTLAIVKEMVQPFQNIILWGVNKRACPPPLLRNSKESSNSKDTQRKPKIRTIQDYFIHAHNAPSTSNAFEKRLNNVDLHNMESIAIFAQ